MTTATSQSAAALHASQVTIALWPGNGTPAITSWPSLLRGRQPSRSTCSPSAPPTACLPWCSSTGAGAGIFGFQHVDAIDAWVPLFLFSVLFALSMDYQVFLMSRIKERYDRSGSTRDAVINGVSSTARIITGAALIIVIVFSGFARGQLVMFQQMGFGVAAALLLDATVVRMVILPSALGLLGRRSWYLPRWLTWLPRLEVEAPPVSSARR